MTKLQKKLLKVLSVGFRNNNIRLELRQVLKNDSITDEELMEEVDMVMQREKEHQEKFGKSVSGKVSTVDCTKKDGGGGEKMSAAETQILAEIKQLHVKVGEVGKVSSRVDKLTADMEDLRQTVANIASVATFPVAAVGAAAPGTLPQVPAVGGRFRGIKCRSCEEQRLFCRHCNVCGAEGHKRKDCPANPANVNAPNPNA